MINRVVLVFCFCFFLGSPLLGQLGTGHASGITVDITGNVLDATAAAGAEVGPEPYVQMVDQTTADVQSVTAANVNLFTFESNAGANVATVMTRCDDAIGAQLHRSSAELDDVDVLSGILVVGNFVTITASNISTTAEVTGACGATGGNDLTEAGTSSVQGLTVSVLGVNLVNNMTTTNPIAIDLSSTALGILGVTGSLFINRVTLSDGGASGTGSATAVGLSLSVDAGIGVVGLGNVARISITIAESFASRDCDNLPVELMSFSVE